MKLTILGSGTFVHQLNRNNPSYLLENKEKKILFDFGRGCINQLLKLDKNLHEIDAIFISHMHADHSSELASFFLFILDSPNKSEIKKEYFIYGPSGIEKDLNNILKAFHLNKKKNVNRIIINELSNGNSIKIGDINVKSFEVEHEKGINSLAYRIIDDKKIICYSGDSTDCKGLRKACNNSDLAVMEATGPKSWRLKTHLNGEELGKLAQEENVKRLIATHIASTYLNDVKKDIQIYFKGNAEIAQDFMEVSL